MYILSFDVGIKNLAYCLIDYTDDKTIIKEWNIVNLTFEDTNNEDMNYFLGHYKTMNIKELKIYMEKYNLDTNKKKPELIKIVEQYFVEQKYILKKNSIQDIGKILVLKLDSLEHLKEADLVLIENQPSLKNPIMKSVQMILYSYFLIRGLIDLNKIKEIKLISAMNKLKKCKDIEQFKSLGNSYSQRKKLAIQYCCFLLEKNESKEQQTYFIEHQKKDDLADCYLQGIYYIDKLIK